MLSLQIPLSPAKITGLTTTLPKTQANQRSYRNLVGARVWWKGAVHWLYIAPGWSKITVDPTASGLKLPKMLAGPANPENLIINLFLSFKSWSMWSTCKEILKFSRVLIRCSSRIKSLYASNLKTTSGQNPSVLKVRRCTRCSGVTVARKGIIGTLHESRQVILDQFQKSTAVAGEW